MAFFEDVGRKISKTSQGVVQSTKDMSAISKLNSQIADEQRKIAQLYSQIGKLYFETFGTAAEEPFTELCAWTAASFESIEKSRAEIAQIKGITRCPKCGSEVSANSAFCNVCGERMPPMPAKIDQAPPDLKTCGRCGTQMPASVAFCSGCGERMLPETPPPRTEQATVDIRICERCGASVPALMAFCVKCGNPMPVRPVSPALTPLPEPEPAPSYEPEPAPAPEDPVQAFEE